MPFFNQDLRNKFVVIIQYWCLFIKADNFCFKCIALKVKNVLYFELVLGFVCITLICPGLQSVCIVLIPVVSSVAKQVIRH